MGVTGRVLSEKDGGMRKGHNARVRVSGAGLAQPAQGVNLLNSPLPLGVHYPFDSAAEKRDWDTEKFRAATG
jgi:hypothetical protein